MKSRILEKLSDFSKDKAFNDPLFIDLVEELKTEPKPLQNKAKKVLKIILHNYSFFDILTIDGFNHRLIRTFARDLKLNQNFEIELDNKLLANNAVNMVLDKAGFDEKLTKILVGFSLDKIEDDRSWNSTTNLTDIAKLLLMKTILRI